MPKQPEFRKYLPLEKRSRYVLGSFCFSLKAGD